MDNTTNNAAINSALNNDGRKTQYITFVGPDEEGFYTMVNLVRRKPYGNAFPIKAGATGGRVEHPEDIDIYSPVWAYRKAIIKGHTEISGKVSINRATITDSIITGKVEIALDSKPVKEDTLGIGNQVLITDSTITGYEGDADEPPYVDVGSSEPNSPEEDGEGIKITDRARIDKSMITGYSKISKRAHIISSRIETSVVTDFAFVSKSFLYAAVAAGSAEVLNSEIRAGLVHDNAIVRGANCSGEVFENTAYYEKGTMHKSIDFGQFLDL